MKNLLILIFSLFALNSFAMTDVEVLSSKLGVRDFNNEKTLCVTVVKLPEDGSIFAVVEDIYDCFYARMAKCFPNDRLKIELHKLQVITHPKLHKHLQNFDSGLEFYFSDGE